MSRFRKLTAVCAVAVMSAAAVPLTASADKPSASIIATFEGHQIRLADGWGDATACTSDGKTARCYRTEAEMDAVEGDPTKPADRFAMLADCALPGARLYHGAGYSGSVLQLTTRFVTINLAPHGFDNITSSYKIGACAARLYDTTAGGTTYPGNTAANVWASSMVSGWDNRVGSVYIS